MENKIDTTSNDNELQTAIFIILLLIILGLCVGIYFQFQDKITSIGNLTIKESQFNSIVDAVPAGKFKICHIDTNECVVLEKSKIE